MSTGIFIIVIFTVAMGITILQVLAAKKNSKINPKIITLIGMLVVISIVIQLMK